MNNDPLESDRLELLRQGQYQFRMGEYINEGMRIFRQAPGMFVGFTLLMFLISAVASFVPFGSLLVGVPLQMGFFAVADKIMRGEQVAFDSFFDGFRRQWGQLVLGGLMAGLLTAVGLVFCIIPGIFLAIALQFCLPLIFFGNMEFSKAMGDSIRIISKKWFAFFGFSLVLGLINIGGLLLLGVGFLFTLPISICAQYACYRQIVGTGDVVIPGLYNLLEEDRREY